MKPVYSWGRHPDRPQMPITCHWQADLPEQIKKLQQRGVTTLPFGNGRSYGDSCLASSNEVMALGHLDRFIDADWQTGVIRAECGVTLGDILQLAIPYGWFLPVTPGTKFVTLGGAVANDVHGKNHHVKGTFGRHIRRFCLLRSDMKDLICSPTQNADLFAASIGGLGLTGIIRWVELQLMPISSTAIEQTQVRFDSLREFFALSAELDSLHEYTVAWIDCLAKGTSAGRGVFITGNHAMDGELRVAEQKKLRIPFTPPVSAINSLTLQAFNTAYFHIHKAGRHSGRVNYEPFFYPLDRILEWNRIYGPRGFQQYQCVIPQENGQDGIAAMLAAIAAEGMGSFLAVLKRCGNLSSPGLLSFPLEGVSLALDFPQHNMANTKLFSRLDSILRETGGRLYPAKDAHMSGDDFRTSYPAWEKIEALRDPLLYSHFWQRVTSR